MTSITYKVGIRHPDGGIQLGGVVMESTTGIPDYLKIQESLNADMIALYGENVRIPILVCINGTKPQSPKYENLIA